MAEWNFHLLRARCAQYARKLRLKRHKLFLAGLLGIFGFVLFLHHWNAQIQPQLTVLAETQMQNEMAQIAEQAVSTALESVDADSLVTIHTANGKITALTTNTACLNALRTAVMEDIVSRLQSLDDPKFGIPLGTLFGSDLLSAWGPVLPIRVLSVASADALYRNDFHAAGINQTLHRIMLDVTVQAKLLLPSGTLEVSVTTPVCVAETVLVGETPDLYLAKDVP